MERVRAFIFNYRRPLAAVFAALGVLAAIEALQTDGGPTASMTVAARNLASGQEVAASDLKSVHVPAGAIPQGALDESDAVGRRVAGPMRSGEPFTDRRVLSPRDLDGRALSIVPIDDRATLIGLRVGDTVDVVAPSAGNDVARVVVSGAIVAALPPSDRSESTSVGLTTNPPDAVKLADATVSGGLRLVVRS